MLGLGHKGPKTMLGLGHKGPKTISLGINSSVGAWAIQRPTSCSLQGVSMRPEGIASRRIRLQLGELEADHRPPHTVAVVQHPSQPGQCQPSRHVSRVLVLPGSTSSSQVASICSKAPRRSLRTRPADELAQAGVPGWGPWHSVLSPGSSLYVVIEHAVALPRGRRHGLGCCNMIPSAI